MIRIRLQVRLWMLLALVALVALALGGYGWWRGRQEMLRMARWHEARARAFAENALGIDVIDGRGTAFCDDQLEIVKQANALRQETREKLQGLGEPIPAALEGSLEAKQQEVEEEVGLWKTWRNQMRAECQSASTWHDARAKELERRLFFVRNRERATDQRQYERERRGAERIDKANRLAVEAAHAKLTPGDVGTPQQLMPLIDWSGKPDSLLPLSVVRKVSRALEQRKVLDSLSIERRIIQQHVLDTFLASTPRYTAPSGAAVPPPAPPPPPSPTP